MIGMYLYLGLATGIFIWLMMIYLRKRKQAKEDYETRENDVFYKAVKNIRRD